MENGQSSVGDSNNYLVLTIVLQEDNGIYKFSLKILLGNRES